MLFFCFSLNDHDIVWKYVDWALDKDQELSIKVWLYTVKVWLYMSILVKYYYHQSYDDLPAILRTCKHCRIIIPQPNCCLLHNPESV